MAMKMKEKKKPKKWVNKITVSLWNDAVNCKIKGCELTGY